MRRKPPRPAASRKPDRLLAISEAGARDAANALARMIGRPVSLDLPRVRTVPLEDVSRIAGGASRVVCALSLKVHGEARGNLLLLFATDQVPLLLRLMAGGSGASADEPLPSLPADAAATPMPLTDLQRSALMEVGNILAGAYLNAVSRMIGMSLMPSIPGLALDMVGAVTDIMMIERAPLTDVALVLASGMREPSSGLRGEIFFLPDPATLPALQRPLHTPS